MAKNYRIGKEPRFGFDRVIYGPGVCMTIAPEAVPTVKQLEVLPMLEGAYAAGYNEAALRGPRDEFERHLLVTTREVVAAYADTALDYSHTTRLLGVQKVKTDKGKVDEVTVAILAVRKGQSVWEVIDSGLREHALIAALLREVETPPQMVNKSRLLQLLREHLPELAAAHATETTTDTETIS